MHREWSGYGVAGVNQITDHGLHSVHNSRSILDLGRPAIMYLKFEDSRRMAKSIGNAPSTTVAPAAAAAVMISVILVILARVVEGTKNGSDHRQTRLLQRGLNPKCQTESEDFRRELIDSEFNSRVHLIEGPIGGQAYLRRKSDARSAPRYTMVMNSRWIHGFLFTKSL